MTIATVRYHYMTTPQLQTQSANPPDDIFTATVSDLGRVSIPAEVRRLLKLKTKDKVIFRIEHDQVRIEPVLTTLEEIAGSVMPLQPEKDIEERIRDAKEERLASKKY